MRTPEQMRALILNYIERHKSAKIARLSKFFGYEPDYIRRHLNALIIEGKIHRVPGPQQSSGGRSFIYHFGPAPKPVAKVWKPLGINDPWMLPSGFFLGGQAV